MQRVGQCSQLATYGDTTVGINGARHSRKHSIIPDVSIHRSSFMHMGCHLMHVESCKGYLNSDAMVVCV